MLNESNYFSPENRLHFMGASQYKSFLVCPASALAEVRGEWEQEKSIALQVGCYIDQYFSGTLDLFKAQNPEIYTKQGSLKAEYKQAETIIQRIERDPLFCKYLSGTPQVIMTGAIEGVPVKIKIDSYHKDKAIVDLKVMRDMQDVWKDGNKMPFWQAWGYDIQGAFYHAIEGNSLPFFLAVATKEKETDIAIYQMSQPTLDYAMEIIRTNIKRFDDIKKNLIEPERCGKCDYCKLTKVLSEIEEI